MSSPANVHLLVLCHGMWGSPSHLASLKETISARYPPKTPGADGDAQLVDSGADAENTYEFEVLAAESNQDQHTYDGIDWGGERLVAEIHKRIEAIESSGSRKVTRFSITGYSLGGLLARYVIGALYAQKFFDRVEPVNLNTIATPHLGIPLYPTFVSSMFGALGPKLLGRTGPQFYAVDKWNGPEGRPLLEIMSEHDSVFYKALALFPNVTIYANTVHDTTVPYVTAAIETFDPFLDRETNGLEIVLDEKYSPVVKSYHVPSTPPPPPPSPPVLSKAYWASKKPRIFIPPFLRFSKFPFSMLNVLIYAALPVLIPVLMGVAITRLSLDTRASNRRTKELEDSLSAMEEGDRNSGGGGGVKYLRRLIRELEESVEDGAAAVLGEDGGGDVLEQSQRVMGIPSSSEEEDGEKEGKSESDVYVVVDGDENAPVPSSSSSPSLSRARPSTPSPTKSSLSPAPSQTPLPAITTTTTTAPSSSSSSSPSKPKSKSTQPVLTPVQQRIAASLNGLPQLKKVLVYIAAGTGADAVGGDTHSHAIIVARDMKRFERTHKRGLAVVRHWADGFIL